MLENIQGVVFDLDGTLIDSMDVWLDIDKEFLGKRGIAVPDNINEITEGNSFTETAILFKRLFNLTETIEEIKAEWIEMAIVYYGKKIRLKDGVQELLDELMEKNIKMAIATSCTRKLVDAVICQHNLNKYFEVIVTSCEVNRGKPYPDVFLKALEKINVKSENSLAFEDTMAGVLAAKAAKMKVVAIYDKHSAQKAEELQKIADYYIFHMQEVINKKEKAS